MPSCLPPGKKKKKKKNKNKKKRVTAATLPADKVAHPHEHVSIITVLCFPGPARPPGDAAIGQLCRVLRRRVVQHSCEATHNQSDSGLECLVSACTSTFLFLSALVRNRHSRSLRTRHYNRGYSKRQETLRYLQQLRPRSTFELQPANLDCAEVAGIKARIQRDRALAAHHHTLRLSWHFTRTDTFSQHHATTRQCWQGWRSRCTAMSMQHMATACLIIMHRQTKGHSANTSWRVPKTCKSLGAKRCLCLALKQRQTLCRACLSVHHLLLHPAGAHTCAHACISLMTRHDLGRPWEEMPAP